MNDKISRYKIGCLPIINSIIERLDLRNILGRYIDFHGNEKIDCVDSLVMLILNIVVERKPLYKTPAWIKKHHCSLFNVSEEDFEFINDDRFSRAIKKIYHSDRSTIMTELILKTKEEFDIKIDQFNNDSTSLKSYGKMPGKTDSNLEFKRGKSKDHRPDLKQILFTLTISSDGAIPVHFKTYPGNRTDDTTHIETWDSLRKIFNKNDFLYVADCKVCTKKQLDYIFNNGGRVVTVMPETWGEVKEFKDKVRARNRSKKEIHRVQTKEESCFDDAEYCYYYEVKAQEKTYEKNYNIHWIHSSEKKKSDLKKREKALKRAVSELQSLSLKLNKRNLKNKEKIIEKYSEILKKRKVSKFFTISLIEKEIRYNVKVGAGRPGKLSQSKIEIVNEFELSWNLDKELLSQEKRADGLFPLLSTDNSLAAKEVLKAYKYQPQIEKRFSHLKSVLLNSSLFSKNVKNVEGLMFLLFIALLILSLTEREMRKKMKTLGLEYLEIYPEDRRSIAPTAATLIDRFDDLYLSSFQSGKVKPKIYKDDMTDTQKKIINLFDIIEEKFWPDY
jgi:transposase